MKKTAFILILMLSAVPMFAQHGTNGYTGFSLTSPAQFSVGTDTNFLVDRTSPDQKLLTLSLPASVLSGAPNIMPLQLDDKVYLLKAPTLSFVSDSRKRQFDFSYQPEFEIFQNQHDQNSWNSNANVGFTYLLSRRWQAYAGDGYRSSKDPSRTLQNPLLLLPRSQYRENDFRASLTFTKSERTGYVFRYDNTAATFGVNDPLQRKVLDMISNGATVGVTHMLSRKHRIRVLYSVFTASPWNRQKTADEHVDSSFTAFKRPAHSVTGEYRFSLNPKTVIEVSGGGVHTVSGMNYTYSAFAERRLGDIWVGGGYSRSLSLLAGRSLLPSGLSANSFYEILNFHMRGQLSRKVAIETNINRSREVYGTLLAQSETWLVRGRADYRLNERLVLFVTDEIYKQNRNDYVAAPLNRNRFFGGFEYSFTSETERRTSRLVRDSDNVALTEHSRLRARPQQ